MIGPSADTVALMTVAALSRARQSALFRDLNVLSNVRTTSAESRRNARRLLASPRSSRERDTSRSLGHTPVPGATIFDASTRGQFQERRQACSEGSGNFEQGDPFHEVTVRALLASDHLVLVNCPLVYNRGVWRRFACGFAVLFAILFAILGLGWLASCQQPPDGLPCRFADPTLARDVAFEAEVERVPPSESRISGSPASPISVGLAVSGIFRRSPSRRARWPTSHP